MTPIGIAVVEWAGRFLVGLRGDDGPLAGCAEFPGGKCLPGESPCDAACRECREETGLNVLPIRLLQNRVWTYPHGMVDLHFWLCHPSDPQTVAADHDGFRWIAPIDLPPLPFPPANGELIKTLASLPDETA